MPRVKVRVVNINDDSTYGDVAEAIVENEKVENETPEETEAPAVEPPKPKARAKRVPKPKAVVADVAIDVDTPVEVETPTPVLEPKPRAKRTAKTKVIELPPVAFSVPSVLQLVLPPRVPVQRLSP